jgi:Phage gp6-like head-tail connector protein
MSVALVTLSEAKLHLRLTTTTEDEAVLAIALRASDVIVDYLGPRADDTWTAETVPPVIKAAVLLMLSHLYVHRGDDPSTDDKLWEAIARLLMRRRDPALA